MRDQQSVSCVDQHVQPLPNRRREIPQPEIVAGRGHQEENQKREESQSLERKLRQAVIPGVADEYADQRIDVAKGMKLNDGECPVRQSEQKRCDSQMPPVVEQGKKTWVQPAERTDRE